MPSRSFFFPPDFKHVERILYDAYGDSCRTQIEIFRENKRVPILDEESIAKIIGISPYNLYKIENYKRNYYRSFSIPKKDGSKREIFAPRTYLKVVQWWILDNIIRKEDFPDYVTGFRQNYSPYKNAEYHSGAKHVLNVDIKDFFPLLE